VIIYRADQVIAEVDHFLTRLALAHEDVLAIARTPDSGRRRDWRDIRLEGLRDSLAVVKGSRAASITALDRAFTTYRETALAMLADGEDADKPKPTEKRLKAAYAATRSAGEMVLRAARQGKGSRTAVIWLGAAFTSILVSTIQNRLERLTRDQETMPSQAMVDRGACTNDDLTLRGSLVTAAGTECHAWTIEAWRASDYALQATVPREGGALLQIALTLNDRVAPLQEVGWTAGPGPEATTYACRVSNGTRFRIIAWYRVPAGAGPLSVVALPKERTETPCTDRG
jgi:hypothetical protein